MQVFAFDQVFSPEATQLEVFSKCAAPLVEQLCDGFNCTVFAYGQTGSGKTHTMMGTAADPGITPRVCWYLFDRLGRQPGAAARVAVTYLQIYNEGVRDMLAPADADAPPLRVRCCPRRGAFVQNLSEHAVSSPAEIAALLERGNLSGDGGDESQRASSRSHAIFTLHVRQERRHPRPAEAAAPEAEAWREVECVASKMNLVDLAGSERAASGADADPELLKGSLPSTARSRASARWWRRSATAPPPTCRTASRS